jgi:hypothetical protein
MLLIFIEKLQLVINILIFIIFSNLLKAFDKINYNT